MLIPMLIPLVFLAALGAAAYYFRQTLMRWYEKATIFLKEVRVEMQKVVWPSKQEVYGATFVVLVSTVVLTIAIGIEDRLLSSVLDLILSLTMS
jgi:preprotein translocase subunit SecE